MEQQVSSDVAKVVQAQGMLTSAQNDSASLRELLWNELAPTTQYEVLLASNIIELELSYLVSRERVQGILRASARDIVWEKLVRLMTDVPLQDAEQIARQTATAFVQGEAIAEEMLGRYGLTRSDIEAQAYRDNWTLLREVDHVQHRFELRRVALMSDYRSVQKNARKQDFMAVAEVEVS
ncbi:hypothetical protein [Paragemmobacter straminiformis]|uniref:Uncharacterized protein n=1 Tax=Paragemmobacter straminiformis TaxID=2045119 RepID=A0A842I6Z2_9RHOB|nr:hypothetical protein [Gemmobacter straminiformis]MBC2835137.1 hypothetical protein [Gemmobacter straminiformis]